MSCVLMCSHIPYSAKLLPFHAVAPMRAFLGDVGSQLATCGLDTVVATYHISLYLNSENAYHLMWIH